MDEASEPLQALQLPTPSQDLTTEAEDFESNVAGYRNIVDQPAGVSGYKTHIYVGENNSLSLPHVKRQVLTSNIYRGDTGNEVHF